MFRPAIRKSSYPVYSLEPRPEYNPTQALGPRKTRLSGQLLDQLPPFWPGTHPPQSLEPADVTDRLLECFAKNPNIMPHLHLPLQSGSPAILRKMCRQYTRDDFFSVISKVNAVLDRPAITTDIIVGFPGKPMMTIRRNHANRPKSRIFQIHIFPSARAKAPLQLKCPAESIRPSSKPARMNYTNWIHNYRNNSAANSSANPSAFWSKPSAPLAADANAISWWTCPNTPAPPPSAAATTLQRLSK